MTLERALDILKRLAVDTPFPDDTGEYDVRTEYQEPCAKLYWDSDEYIVFLDELGKPAIFFTQEYRCDDDQVTLLDRPLKPAVQNNTNWNIRTWCVGNPNESDTISDWIREHLR